LTKTPSMCPWRSLLVDWQFCYHYNGINTGYRP